MPESVKKAFFMHRFFHVFRDMRREGDDSGKEIPFEGYTDISLRIHLVEQPSQFHRGL